MARICANKYIFRIGPLYRSKLDIRQIKSIRWSKGFEYRVWYLTANVSNLFNLVETAFEVNQSFSKIWNKICDKLDPGGRSFLNILCWECDIFWRIRRKEIHSLYTRTRITCQAISPLKHQNPQCRLNPTLVKNLVSRLATFWIL